MTASILKDLLHEAGGLPHAEALWDEHILPRNPHLDLCNYFVEGEFTTLMIHVVDDGYGNDFDIEVYWSDDDLSMSADDEDREVATLFFPIICDLLESKF